MKKQPSFGRLSKWKQRVEIAKDVILQLKAKTFTARTGSYINIQPIGSTNWSDVNQCQANEIILEKKVSCSVCAKGAMFMSHIMKTNHCTIDQADHADSEPEYFINRLNMFSQGQLDTIEAAFEKRVCVDNEKILSNGADPFSELYGLTDLGWKAVNFSKSKSKTNRMIEIMKNIIKNKGEFKP